MGTEIATRDIPPPTPEIAKGLSPSELSAHRAQIYSEVKIVLSAYFQPDDDPAVLAGQLAWWCDELQDWTREQVVYALRQWNRDNPRRRPTPGDIVAFLKAERGRQHAKRMQQHPAPEPERRRLTPEEAGAILKERGFEPKRMEADQ